MFAHVVNRYTRYSQQSLCLKHNCQIYRGLLPAVANLSDFPQSLLCETKVSCHPGDQR
jgi:hypothetical protein